MAPSDGLGSLKMSISGHHIVNLLFGTGCDDIEEVDQVLLNLSKLVAEPHPHVANDLLIAAAACVKLASNVLANDLAESALVGSKYIFVNARDNGKSAGFPLLFDLAEALLELFKLLLGNDASLCV